MEPSKEELIDCIKNFLGLLDTPLGRKRLPGAFTEECIATGRELISRSVEYPQIILAAETEDPVAEMAIFLRTYLDKLTISAIARLIAEDWPHPNYAAAPYLEAMHSLTNITDTYYADSGKSVVLYFLSNAQSWKGETAKAIKAELKRRCNIAKF